VSEAATTPRAGAVRLAPGPLADRLAAILRARGCGAPEARVVADHLVEANLTGHDSHGVIRVLRYDEWLRTGRLRPGRELRLVAEAGALRQWDGGDGMGQALAREAVADGVARAREMGLAAFSLRRAGHVGRLGAYAEQAAEAGIVSVMFCNVAGSRLVAPFGAAGRAASTAPVAIGVPNPGGAPFILDFATSAVAEGKALVAATGGAPLAEDALLDAEGRPTRDPAALYGETVAAPAPDPRAGPGALRPFGGHKGSGLMLACELLAGALTGNGTNGGRENRFGNGLLAFLIDPARLDDAPAAAEEVATYLAHIRGAAPAPGTQAVLAPGDRERRMRAERGAAGIELPRAVHDAIEALAARHGLPPAPDLVLTEARP
jgi:uncharacterized oxidoreductase